MVIREGVCVLFTVPLGAILASKDGVNLAPKDGVNLAPKDGVNLAPICGDEIKFWH